MFHVDEKHVRIWKNLIPKENILSTGIMNFCLLHKPFGQSSMYSAHLSASGDRAGTNLTHHCLRIFLSLQNSDLTLFSGKLEPKTCTFYPSPRLLRHYKSNLAAWLMHQSAKLNPWGAYVQSLNNPNGALVTHPGRENLLEKAY